MPSGRHNVISHWFPDHLRVTGNGYLAEFDAATGALIREIIASGT